MSAVAKGTRCEDFFYHADINPRTDENLTPEQWENAVDVLEKQLGFEGQPRFVVEHEKEGKDGQNRIHRHVVWSRIDADTMTALPVWRNYEKHEAAARQIEKDCDLEPVASVLGPQREGPRPERRPKNWEKFRGVKSGLDPDDVKKRVTELWQRADNGASFKAALEADGYILCRGDSRDFVIVDPAGDEHSLARRIRGARAKDVRDKMKDIDRDSLLSVAEARELANTSGDNDASWAVLENRLDKLTVGYRRMIERGEMSPPPFPTYEPPGASIEAPQRALTMTGADKAAGAYGKGVKEVAKVGQDAYRRIMDGVKEETTAEKWRKMVMGEEATPEQDWKKDEPDIER